jgi:Transposase, Mutator family
VRLIISDACIGLVEAAAQLFPEAQWQRRVVHFYRNLFTHVPNGKVADVARMLKAIHAQEDCHSAQDKLREVIAKLQALRLAKAAELLEAKAHETLTYFAFPSNYWRQIKTNNPLERIIRRSFGIDAGRGATAPHREYQVPSGASGVISQWKRCLTRFPRRLLLEIGSGDGRQKCERLLTLPLA